jgi:hypothetical protein
MAQQTRPSVVSTQRDFSAGEIDVAAKRGDDHPMVKAGARQMANWRILNSRGVTNRPGRRVLFSAPGRVEEILMAPGQTFFLIFSNATLQVFNAAGTQVFLSGGMPWTGANLQNVVWASYQLTIWITFPGMKPQLLAWDGVSQSSTWTLSNFAETITAGNQKRTIFYRISPKGVTMLPSAAVGVGITLSFSLPIAVAGMVGTKMRFCGRQLFISGINNPSQLVASVSEALPPGQILSFPSDPRFTFNLGDLVQGATSNASGIVTATTATTVTVQLLQSVSATGGGGGRGAGGTTSTGFIASENAIGAGGSMITSSVATTVPQPVVVWDEEVMNSFRGWPASVFFDQGRLGFTNFPSVPSGIAWSAFGNYSDFYVDAPPTSAMFEIAPDKTQVYFVVPGPESGEFVFGDRKLYYIPISVNSPLKPGGVAFNVLDSDGAAPVQPRAVKEIILYVASGGRRVAAVIAPGAYYRPFNTVDASELHDHLFSNIIALAAPSADGTFPERYAYALNANGTLAVGKYTVKSGVLADPFGWLPWSGGGTMTWVAALSADVVFTASYAPNGIAAVNLVEILDDSRRLDASQLYNTQPSGLPIPGGKGPLWYLAGGSVDLMDGPAGTRMMGTYLIDANGFLIPQNNAGEDFTSANLVVGQAWQATLEPFVPAVQPGQDVGQRLWPRRIQRVQVYVLNSSGFVMARLYSDQSGPNLPAPGTVMKRRRFPAWTQDEDPTQPPTLREKSELDRPLGRSHDPRWAVIKDTPGPLTVAEISIEVTV